ncbi:MAG TPA: diacylglycerol kinase family protein [Bacteroidia bacterium]|nr:diacylglycerol kinase family protein [Bacteroidia bacterium]
MEKIYFLVNPISGGRNKTGFDELVRKTLDLSKYDYKIQSWDNPEKLGEMLDSAIAAGYTTIVAAGGDGTLNQVAAKLAGTNIKMGIVPMGSGNGFARHNGIPMDTMRALERLNTPTVKKVDTILINNQRYVNVAGVGFDAHIGYLFSVASERGFKTYAKIVIRELSRFESQRYKLVIDGNEYIEKAFLISVANGSQWGNNAAIAPEASTRDGLMDVIVMKPFKFYQAPLLAFQMFTKKINRNSLIKSFKAKSVTIYREDNGAVHFDGEPAEMGSELAFKIEPASLNLLV